MAGEPAAPGPPDAQAFRRVMGRFATGVTVVTAWFGREVRGMTANAFCSVSLEPLLLLVSVHEDARLLEAVRASGAFAVNILGADQEPLARRFAGAEGGRFAEFRFEPWEGAPRLAGCLGAAACTVETLVPAGDHVLVLGRVRALHEGALAPPLVFWAGGYRRLAEPHAVPGEPIDPFARRAEPIYYDERETG